ATTRNRSTTDRLTGFSSFLSLGLFDQMDGSTSPSHQPGDITPTLRWNMLRIIEGFVGRSSIRVNMAPGEMENRIFLRSHNQTEYCNAAGRLIGSLGTLQSLLRNNRQQQQQRTGRAPSNSQMIPAQQQVNRSGPAGGEEMPVSRQWIFLLQTIVVGSQQPHPMPHLDQMMSQNGGLGVVGDQVGRTQQPEALVASGPGMEQATTLNQPSHMAEQREEES